MPLGKRSGDSLTPPAGLSGTLRGPVVPPGQPSGTYSTSFR